ncbi:hypothetical protein H4R20_004637, partial [Coemansia guatemalensis]
MLASELHSEQPATPELGEHDDSADADMRNTVTGANKSASGGELQRSMASNKASPSDIATTAAAGQSSSSPPYEQHMPAFSRGSISSDRDIVDGNVVSSEEADQTESDEELELNRMISNIGFGKYHRRVLALCGLGWTADNAWMQCTACILPRIQQHFAVSNARIGLMSSSMFLGLTCGALVWGPISDRFGRLLPYRWTLVVSATFGLLASATPSFSLLCLCLFGLGSGVGGNMPVDGAIFLECIPREKRHLLTLLSVFFSLGSVLTSAVALAILPPFS